MGLKVEEIRAPDNKNVSYNKYGDGGSTLYTVRAAQAIAELIRKIPKR